MRSFQQMQDDCRKRGHILCFDSTTIWPDNTIRAVEHAAAPISERDLGRVVCKEFASVSDRDRNIHEVDLFVHQQHREPISLDLFLKVVSHRRRKIKEQNRIPESVDVGVALGIRIDRCFGLSVSIVEGNDIKVWAEGERASANIGPFDDGRPSEAHLHGGRTGWIAVIDERPVATTAGESGLLPESSLAWRKVEACERCARRLGGR